MANKKVGEINPVRNCRKGTHKTAKKGKSEYNRISNGVNPVRAFRGLSGQDEASNGVKIIIDGNRPITRRDLFEKKEEFHREQAKLPFEEKIKILVQLQKIANSVQNFSKSGRSGFKKGMIWRL